MRCASMACSATPYDFHLAGIEWEELPVVVERILAVPGDQILEARSWRPRDFRRFVIGRLPDGREERIEFWRRNHLLAPFSELYPRGTEGAYGGGAVAFLSLKDLLRSKETEREDDCRDIELLEEIHDERNGQTATDAEGRAAFLSELRSRRGFESALRAGLLDKQSARRAWARAAHPISRAYLAPYISHEAGASQQGPTSMMDEIIQGPLRSVEPASSRHLALGETVRRLYKREAMEEARRDKIEQFDSSS